jgi:CRISPR-associated protein Cas2
MTSPTIADAHDWPTLLDRYGDRVQYSVFVVQIRPAKMVRLLEDIYITIDTRLDSVLICDLGRAEKSASTPE